MPVITVGILRQTKEKKKEIIEKLTKALVEVTNVPAQAVVVLINEYDDESCGTGGVPLCDRKK